jgi:diaminopimelate epimerase
MTLQLRGTVFYKMSGSGNDFVMLDGRHTAPSEWTAERIVGVCDRRDGVGADGLVILTGEAEGRVRMDFWNRDGSRADMCGNAALCSTRLSAFLELASAREMELVTRAGTFLTRCRPEAEEAELHLPDFRLPTGACGVALGPGEAGGRLATVGVPHLVIEVSDLMRADLMARGQQLRSDPAIGPAGANVNFLAPAAGEANRWSLRTYERGVEGETLACGTGAVAAAAILAQAGRAKLPLEIQTQGGRILHIAATVSDGWARDVWLRGEGRLVFTGIL